MSFDFDDRRLGRRAWLQAGFSTLAGIALPDLLAAQALARTQHSAQPRAKSVILVLLTGGASQQDTFDPKPAAPAEVRGEFKPIDTQTTGLQFCEHLPLLAARTKQLAVVRTMSHGEYGHLPATHTTLTGMRMPNQRNSDLENVLSRRDWPCYAAGLDYLRPRSDGVPNGVTLPHRLIEGPLTWPGQHAGLLGANHDPWEINSDPNDAKFRVDSLALPNDLNERRLGGRRGLWEQLEIAAHDRQALSDTAVFAQQQELAMTLLTSGKVTEAFRIDREPDAVRERYGRHLFGQSLLLARRLVEAGVPIVQANMGIVQSWDTHADNFGRLKDKLLPPLDRGLTALIDDLAATGRLAETLIVVTGEFGRTPKISMLPGASLPGRDHWAPVYAAVFAGGGVSGGQVIGRSDKQAALPVTRSYRPEDLGATVYHALGVDAAAEVRDTLGRPLRLNNGEPITALFSGAAV
ncbi:MAG TPA: DUF1501 domain-containing protein [Pirellulales bacterium]|nr:DUF1501 domain-containing protein [Pirellulales bacterium]